MEEGRGNLDEGRAGDHISIKWDTPRGTWDVVGHLSLEFAVDPADLDEAVPEVLAYGERIVNFIESKYGTTQRVPQRPTSTAASNEAHERAAPPPVEAAVVDDVPDFPNLTPEQRVEFAGLVPAIFDIKPEWYSGKKAWACFYATAKAAGIYMKQAGPAEAEAFMGFARDAAALRQQAAREGVRGDDLDDVWPDAPDVSGGGAKATASRAAAGRHNSPFN